MLKNLYTFEKSYVEEAFPLKKLAKTINSKKFGFNNTITSEWLQLKYNEIILKNISVISVIKIRIILFNMSSIS